MELLSSLTGALVRSISNATHMVLGSLTVLDLLTVPILPMEHNGWAVVSLGSDESCQ